VRPPLRHWFGQLMPRRRDRFGAVSHALHRAAAGPPEQIPPTPIASCGYLPAVKAQEVEPLLSILQARRPSTAPSLRPGSVVPDLSGTMSRSDARSALTHFAGTPRIGRAAPSPRIGLHPVRHCCWGEDGALLFPRRLCHRFTPRTPQGASVRHVHVLHPFRGLRSTRPGSAPCWLPKEVSARRGRLRFMPRTGGLHPPREGSAPRFDAWVSPNAGGLLQRWLGPSLGRTSTGKSS